MGAIFVVGMYGSGKSFYSQNLGQNLNINYYDASSLIGVEINHSFLGDKRVRDLKFTEKVLFSVIDKISQKEKKFIVTGHFCILKDEGYDVIEICDFNPENIDKIIVITANLNFIYNNLIVKNIRLDKQIIQNMQEAEVTIAKRIASFYDLPLEIVGNNF